MRRLLFLLFFLSGFSSLVYQVVWTRMAFASFGIILPVLSVVISVFMLGLALGAWAAGRLIPVLQRKTGLSAAVFYAITELIIGLAAFAVPRLFKTGEALVLGAGQSDSAAYLSLSAMVLTLAILPWCICMGATFPLMMAYVREREPATAESFSFLYLANVLGAMSGTLLTAVALVELLGFHRTLGIAALGNAVVVLISGYLGWRQSHPMPRAVHAQELRIPGPSSGPESPPRMAGWILFWTGFSAMAMEVVWTRAFTPVLKTQVYSFASIIFCYLAATSIGSWLYRRDLRNNRVRSMPELFAFLAIAALLPVLLEDFRLLRQHWRGPLDPLNAVILLSSIGPLCAALGYLTPRLIDSYSRGHPGHAGEAYGLNVLGCILGPLFACYILLPRISERHALILLSCPLFLFWVLNSGALARSRRWGWGLATAVALACSLFVTEDFQSGVSRVGKNTQIRRDYAAFVLSVGEDRDKLLMVNGMDMTVLSPVTKYMVHLPMTLHHGPPKSVLIICFGMGTTHRSALSWDVDTTTVELVPSVRDAFSFYHADASQVLHNPKGRIVIDDGRRYLKRTSDQFDVIVIDPPPPAMAAGSSLLYSVEFYQLAKQHLKPNGILQNWVPRRNIQMAPPVYRSLCDAFPFTRCFSSLEAGGYHMLGSMEPIDVPALAEILARIPPAAQTDLLEWSHSRDLSADFREVLSNEISARSVLDPNREVRVTDNRPYNEYFLLREFLDLRLTQ